jgi:hypothetical protein
MSAQRQVGKDEMRFWFKAKGKRPRRRRLGPHPHRRKSKDRFGNPMTVKVSGKVEPFYVKE